MSALPPKPRITFNDDASMDKKGDAAWPLSNFGRVVEPVRIARLALDELIDCARDRITMTLLIPGAGIAIALDELQGFRERGLAMGSAKPAQVGSEGGSIQTLLGADRVGDLRGCGRCG